MNRLLTIVLIMSAGAVSARVDSPEDASSFNNRAYIVVDDGIHGEELWSTDGTDAGTVLARDINPGPAGSRIFGLTMVGSSLFFSADDGTHGWELWRSDGTPHGTVLVKAPAAKTGQRHEIAGYTYQTNGKVRHGDDQDFLRADRIRLPDGRRGGADTFAISVAGHIGISRCDDHAIGCRIIRAARGY